MLFGCKNDKDSARTGDSLDVNTQELIIVDQNYTEALAIASSEDKSIFIDFYTTWCAPCKELDKLIFQNDSIAQILGKDFILLKYDAENDSVFHLSKKHHVSSYPTGIILNKEGYVLNRKYGFPGEGFAALSKNVLEFTKESIELNAKNEIVKGYSNMTDASKYPSFYVDYVNRTNTKIDPLEVNEYLNTAQDVFSEEYFSTLIYFARNASNEVANNTLKNQKRYEALYGKTDVETLMYFLTAGKFKQAITENSQEKYDEAVLFAKTVLSKKWTDGILPSFEKEFLMSQNRWVEVLEINENLKNIGELENGYMNHFSWQVYKDCDDPEVIKKCLEWMKAVTEEEPTYAYLDTYAYLLYKSGNKKETKKIAQLAIEVAEKDSETAKSMVALMSKL